MQIKTTDGSYDVASKNLANTALGFGVAGLATSLLGGAGSLMGLNGMGRNTTPDERPVTQREMDLLLQIQQKDATIAIKESENYTDKKLVEVTTYVDTKINRLADKVDGYYHEQQGVNAQQMAYNAAANAAIDVIKSQVAALGGVTKVYIPSSNVCQSGCGCGCSQQGM